MESPPLTVLIPTHGRPTLLKRTLDSLAQCVLPESYEELVVIENGSRAGVEKVVASIPPLLNARYMHRERGNKSYALNEAIETVEDGLVVFFDDDVRFNPDILLQYASAAQTEGRGTFFGGPTDVDYDQPPPTWLVPHLPKSAKGWYRDKVEREHDDLFMGFNWAAYRSDVLSVGGFNPTFGPGSITGAVGQETECQARLAAHGMGQVFLANARVWHYVPASRCTPKWVLRRKFREGVKIGLSLQKGELPLLGIPGWCFRALRVMKGGLSSTLRCEWPAAFGQLVALRVYTGILRGYWYVLSR